MLPATVVAEPRVGPQYQAQIPELKPKPFNPAKRIQESSDQPIKRPHNS